MSQYKKVVVVTGSTGVIGTAIAKGVAQANFITPTVSHLILIVRNTHRGEKIAAPLRSKSLVVEVISADLSHVPSIVKAGAQICSTYPYVSVLVNNAAVVSTRREEVDGLECQFATNVLAYHALAKVLLPAMTSGGRVVHVASNLAGGLDLADLQSRRGDYDARAVYSRTKQAARMLAAEAAMDGRGFKEAGVLVTACHPGVVTSTLLENLGYHSGIDAAPTAAQTPLRLALGPAMPSGTYCMHGGFEPRVVPFRARDCCSDRLPCFRCLPTQGSPRSRSCVHLPRTRTHAQLCGTHARSSWPNAWWSQKAASILQSEKG